MSSLVLALLLVSSSELALDAPGKVRPFDRGGDGEYSATPRGFSRKQSEPMMSKVEVFLAPLLAALGEPVGFEAAPHRSVFHDRNIKDGPVCAGIWIQLFDLYRHDNGKIEPGGESGTSFFIMANDVRVFFDDVIATDALGEMFMEPKRTGSRGGFPVYNGSIILVAKNSSIPWRTVSRERYAAAVLAYQKKEQEKFVKSSEQTKKSLEALLKKGTIKELPPELPSPYLKTIAAIEGGLAKFSDEERKQPMIVSPGASVKLWLGFEPSGGRPVVEVDPAYFDLSLGATSIQLIAFHGRVGSVQLQPIHDRYVRIVKKIDFTTYAKLLEAP